MSDRMPPGRINTVLDSRRQGIPCLPTDGAVMHIIVTTALETVK